jgi:multidrug efflux pump
MSGTIMQTPGMHFPISTYQANVPQLDVQVDRDKAKAQGVSLTDLFGTLQTYLGSSYVNDFNQFGRTWRVMAQADGRSASVEDIANLRTRNNQGEMVPIGSMVNISTTYGPDPVIRYNGYPAADLIGDADPRVLSSSQAMTQLERCPADIAERDEYRMDGSELPAGHAGQYGADRLPGGGAAGVPGAGGAV